MVGPASRRAIYHGVARHGCNVRACTDQVGCTRERGRRGWRERADANVAVFNTVEAKKGPQWIGAQHRFACLTTLPCLGWMSGRRMSVGPTPRAGRQSVARAYVPESSPFLSKRHILPGARPSGGVRAVVLGLWGLDRPAMCCASLRLAREGLLGLA